MSGRSTIIMGLKMHCTPRCTFYADIVKTPSGKVGKCVLFYLIRRYGMPCHDDVKRKRMLVFITKGG